jgi:hypothetical protein
MVVKIGGSDFVNYIDDGEKGATHIHRQQKNNCIVTIGDVNTCTKMLKHLLSNKY